jgi:trehalose-6-phosphatase
MIERSLRRKNVKEAANRLRSQPPGVVEVLSGPGRQQLEEKLGLPLPEK